MPRATPTDEALVAEAAAGDANAFALLVSRYAAPVLAVVERASGDHHLARDLTQEIWIKVHRGLTSFHADRRFRPWLFAIVMNHVRDAQRKSGRRAQHIRTESVSTELVARADDAHERAAARIEIEDALGRVPEPYRGAVHLVDVVGLDYDAAAQALECSAGTVKSRVHRGRVAFKEAYLKRRERGRQQEL